MNYAKWESKENLFEHLVNMNLKNDITRGGIPIVYEDNNIYLNKEDYHSLIIGATGSGKTQTTILPLIKLSMLAGESIIVNDINGCIYKKTFNNFKENGYKVVVLNFNKPQYGQSWNPLDLPYKLYKEGKKDKVLKMIEDIGYYLFKDNTDVSDPFWTNMAIDYFSGLVLYLFSKEEKTPINLKNVFKLATDLRNEKYAKKFLEEIGKDNAIYYSVSGTLETANETKASIISVFLQKCKIYTSREELSNMISKSDFDITNILNEKTIVYIINDFSYTSSLGSLFISQICEIKNLYNNNKILNIVLDDFYKMAPIKDAANLFGYAKNINIRLAICVRGFNDLINDYGKENSEIIKGNCGNIIYLLSHDMDTLEEVSKLCGLQEKNANVIPLITVEELKCLDKFEAIFLIFRCMPFKTNLIPDYQIKWPFSEILTELELKK